jgi:hypothetical protein
LSRKRAQAVYDYIRSLISEDEYAILPHYTTIEGYGELYANLLGAAEQAPEWQTVMVYINGQLAFRMAEEMAG